MMKLLASVLLINLLLGPAVSSTRPKAHLRASATNLLQADGAFFQWRGITAFRLAEMVAHGRKAEAAAFLDWAAAEHLTVVRVLTTAKHLFQLEPQEGLAALPDLLELAATRGLYVEVIALADTSDASVDAIDAHVKAVGAIAARYTNALVEIANEPWHGTQNIRLHTPAELRRLATLIPEEVPTAWGSAEGDAEYAGGDYATVHFPRDSDAEGWGHVVALGDGARRIAEWKKPVINDEPIGAAEEFIPAKRDNDPGRFRAAALMSRLAGLGATFHYEDGLQAKIPTGRQLACFNAWNEAWTLLPGNLESEGAFKRAGDDQAAVRSFTKGTALAVVERQRESAWVLALGVRAKPVLQWGPDWQPADVRQLDRIWLIRAERRR